MNASVGILRPAHDIHLQIKYSSSPQIRLIRRQSYWLAHQKNRIRHRVSEDTELTSNAWPVGWRDGSKGRYAVRGHEIVSDGSLVCQPNVKFGHTKSGSSAAALHTTNPCRDPRFLTFPKTYTESVPFQRIARLSAGHLGSAKKTISNSERVARHCYRQTAPPFPQPRQMTSILPWVAFHFGFNPIG